MASIGLKYMAWARIKAETGSAVPTYEPGLVLGKSVSTNLTVNRSEGELYADDMLAEYVDEFSSADFTAEVDNISLDNQAKLYGARMVDGEFQASADDGAPYGGVGGYQSLMVSGERKYRAWFFAKAKASIPDWSGTTKGSSVSFGTQPIKMRIMAPEYGPWYRIKEFASEAAAKAYIDTLLGVTTWYKVDVQQQGEGSVDKLGPTYVASGSDLEINITGTPTALYDNGTEKSSSVSGGKYTLSSVSADHSIAIIF